MREVEVIYQDKIEYVGLFHQWASVPYDYYVGNELKIRQETVAIVEKPNGMVDFVDYHNVRFVRNKDGELYAR